MAEFSSVSSEDLAERRRRLRRQRRWRFLQSSWQILAVTGLAVGAVWVVTLPDWMIRNSGQISIEGNQFLSAEMIRSLLPIHYPQSLLAIQPQAIAHSLESKSPIAEATVVRRLFPPGLTVRIQERYPVAIAYSSPTNFANPRQTGTLSGLAAVAFLDEKGTWIPYETYVSLNQSRKLPTLRVIGLQEQYRPQWADLYQAISRSPVKVSEIDWRDPGNLVLSTELGMVHFGPYGPRFAEQLLTLDRMRQLSKDVKSDQIAYIDLRNPDAPFLQMVQSEAVKQP